MPINLCNAKINPRLLALSFVSSALILSGATAQAVLPTYHPAPDTPAQQRVITNKPKETHNHANATHTTSNGKLDLFATDKANQQAITAAIQKMDSQTQSNLNLASEAVHLQDRAIYNELRDEEESSFSNIGMLWQAAVERSGTIRYAIEKLSHKDATGKPVSNDNFSKRMVQSLIHLGGVAGTMWTGTPAGIIGSNMVDNLMRGNPQDSILSRVTDADMVILAKEVENLQSRLIEVYYNYQHAEDRVRLSQEASLTLSKYYDHAITGKPDATSAAMQPLLQAMYDSAKQDELNAHQQLNSSRTELGLLVGPEAIAALDQSQTQPQSASDNKQAKTD